MSQAQQLPAVEAKLNLQSDIFSSNRSAWQPILDEYQTKLEAAASEGNDHSIKRHLERGQLLARDRIALLLDHDTPFLELGAFAGCDIEHSSPCASMLAGIGSVCGRHCLVLAHIPTLSSGAWNEFTVIKQNRVTEIATENDLPIIALVQSAGVFLPQQFRVFHNGAQIFRDLCIRSQTGKPSCAVVFGSSAAGGAYHPALSDYTIFVEKKAQVFLGGPSLVKMATGEVIDAEELGGASVHGSITGLADQVAVDEFDALRKARDWMLSLKPPDLHIPSLTLSSPLEPRYPAEDILSLVNPDVRKPFDMHEVLLRLVDSSRLLQFKPLFGSNILTCWADILGIRAGIIANQTPIINPNEAIKMVQFIRLCNQQSLPIIFLHNVTGFMVGPKAEHASIINRGAQLVSAVSCSTVPHISVIMGASYGAGNYAMCGRRFKPRFLWSWPNAMCSAMGPDQLAGVMEQIETNSAKTKGVVLDQEVLAKRVEGYRESVRREGRAYSTSATLLDDGIIDPRDTRTVLGMCLEVVTLKPIQGAEAHRALARM